MVTCLGAPVSVTAPSTGRPTGERCSGGFARATAATLLGGVVSSGSYILVSGGKMVPSACGMIILCMGSTTKVIRPPELPAERLCGTPAQVPWMISAWPFPGEIVPSNTVAKAQHCAGEEAHGGSLLENAGASCSAPMIGK